METNNRPADPLAKGTLATAKQSFKDLFIWDQRVVVTNDHGEEYCEWQKPEPLKNPVSLFAQLSFKDWLYFLVGFLAWVCLSSVISAIYNLPLISNSPHGMTRC